MYIKIKKSAQLTSYFSYPRKTRSGIAYIFLE